MPTDSITQASVDQDFLREVALMPGGERVIDCFQCGTCSGSCPTAHAMDHSPRRLFAMVKAGLRSEVLGSNTFWYCTSCYTCTVRCPRQIKITDVMYALKRLSLRDERVRRKNAARTFYRSFAGLVERDGRNFEPELMIRFMLKTDPRLFLKNATLGLKLFTHRRLPIRPTRIRGRKDLQAIIKKAKSRSGRS